MTRSVGLTRLAGPARKKGWRQQAQRRECGFSKLPIPFTYANRSPDLAIPRLLLGMLECVPGKRRRRSSPDDVGACSGRRQDQAAMDWQGMCTFAAALAGLWDLCACLCAFHEWTRRWVLALVEAFSTKSKQRPAWMKGRELRRSGACMPAGLSQP